MQSVPQSDVAQVSGDTQASKSDTKGTGWRKVVIALAFLLLFGGASVVRLMTYDRYLPFVDYEDEPAYVAWALHDRGLSDESALIERFGVPPPAYVWYNILVQTVFDELKSYSYLLPADYYPILRFSAAISGILTTVCIAMLVWIASDWRAAIIGGMVWGFAPIVLEYNSLAIPDPPVYFFTSLTLLAGALAWKKESFIWLFVSLLAGITVIYLKFWIAVILIPFLLVGFAFLLDGRLFKNWIWLLIYAVLSLGSAYYIIFVVNPFTDQNGISDYTSGDLLSRAFDFARLSNNFEKALIPIGTPLFIVTIIVAVILWVISRQRGWKQVNPKVTGMLLVYLLFGHLLGAAISNVTADARMRHIFPIAIAFYALWGIGVGQILMTVDDWLKEQKNLILRHSSSLIAAGLGIFLLVNYLPGDIAIIKKYQREHVVVLVQNWSDDNLLADGLVMHLSQRSDVDRVWNRVWGAYPGDNPFVWWTELPDLIVDTTPENYISRNIFYIITDEESLTDLSPDHETAMRDYLDDLFLIKTFEVDPDVNAGSTVYFYRMFPPENAVSVDFGDVIQLTGYDLSAQTVAAGDVLRFRPYWMSESVPATNYSMFIHLHTAEDLSPVAQLDVPPASPERPTALWDDDSEVYIGRYHDLTIPADLPAGDYILGIGLYDYQTGVRLQTDSGDRFQIPITIEN